MELDLEQLREFLDQKVLQYNTPDFIEPDPVQIPHMYSAKEDIEISGFLTATISWGNRTSILRSAKRMMGLLGNSPYDFIMNHKDVHLKKIEGFVHRTFNSTDLITFIEALKYLYQHRNGLEGVFTEYKTSKSIQPAIHQLNKEFFTVPHLKRTRKHLPDPLSGSAAKKINMYLRWMIRKDNCGVDFGIWKSISPSILSCPLDVHSGNVARKLGLLLRKQNDARAVQELDDVLRQLDINDPVKYDFALFGLGIHENIGKD
ncbi:MAG: TIGR02757 family protein [Bacteroidales bacterium]|nr:TIGR02757 family protein [Bacteroidales bacterium]